MSDTIYRDKAIEAIAEHLMGEAVLEYPDASDNIEDWKEIGEAILESVPPAEVIPKGSDEASLAYAEGWKNGEEAERSRRPKGEWIVYEGGWKDLDYYPPKCKCNQCGYEEELYILNAKPTNFCPNCGSDNRERNDDE